MPSSVFAKDEWLQVRSKNFNLIGNASERDIRKVATRLEQFRETFRQLFKISLSSAIPTNVVVFKSDNSYKPFKPKRADGKADTFVAGYFQPGDDVNYITISTEGEDADTYGTIFHEYVHFIINTNFGKSEVPPWFNEGLAEYYQTFAIEEDQKVKLGLPQSNHLLLLQQTKLIPLDTLFKISNYALHQNENHSRSIFYAQSWALIHYLVQSGKTEGLGNFLTLAMKDVPSEKAFQTAFQTTYAQMEKDLTKYVGQNTYKYSVITFKNKLVFDAEMQTTPLSEAASFAYLGDLLYHTNRADDAEPYLQKTLALAPDSSMANTTLGMVKISQRKFDEAKKFLERAISEDQKNHLAFYRYAYLLSREGRDEFGFVAAFPTEKAAKMREMLNKAIAINPSFTESYELLAFISLVNNERLDEAVAYMQKALKYQPGNQRYALRIAEIYLRQDKFAEASAIADKIAKTADEPALKSEAEDLTNQLRQRQDINAQNEASRKQYEAAIAEASKNGNRVIITRRNSNEKQLSPEELAKMEEAANMRSVNQSIRKAEGNEKQVIGRIQKIVCQGKNITYTVKTDGETFTLSSKDFENLALTSFVADAASVQVGCGANFADLNSVLTYRPAADAKNTNRGELIAVDFVPTNFRMMLANELESEPEAVYVEETTSSSAAPPKPEEFETARRASMMEAIKKAMRQPLAGEKREMGLIEKVECGNKGMFFYLKTPTQLFKLSAASPQAIQIRAFTPEVEQIQLGCNLKQVDIPIVFTYKENPDAKAKSNGEIVALEFMPKSFVLEK
ncbi:MAG: tetratricopeptide repeat protein [Pyrinomonadaceae bacterium]